MLQLCICDDDTNILNMLEKYIMEYSFQKNLDINVIKYSSPECLIDSNSSFDIVFLDIQFENSINGIDAAKAIRRNGNKSLIVFITVHEGFSIKGYEAEAFRFLVKPLGKDEVFNVIDDCVRKLYSGTIVDIKTSLGDEMVKANDILYVLISNRKRVVNTVSGGKLETWMPLKEIQAALPPNLFSMAQQGCLVNLDKVRLLNGYRVCLVDGTELTLSRKYKESFIRDLQGHLRHS